jgi:hypothetical protein
MCIVNGIEEEMNKVFKAVPLFPGKQTFAKRLTLCKLLGVVGGGWSDWR